MQTIEQSELNSQAAEVVLPGGEGPSESAVASQSAETAPPLPVHADRAVVRARAIDLAGHFHSGVADLSEEHDRYLAEAFG